MKTQSIRIVIMSLALAALFSLNGLAFRER